MSESIAGTHHWPLRGWRRARLWIVGVLFLVVAVTIGGLAVAVAVAGGRSWPYALLIAVMALLITALIVTALLRTALAMTVTPDGTVTARRLAGTLHTHASRVRHVRATVGAPGPQVALNPFVLTAQDGTAFLAHSREDVAAIGAVLQRHNPAVLTDTRPGPR